MQKDYKLCTNPSKKNVYISNLNLYTDTFLTEEEYMALSTDWEKLRDIILKRDGYRCKIVEHPIILSFIIFDIQRHGG